MKRLRSKLTYSNLMVTVLAILVIGGGTAYAATEMLPKNSVGSKQIKKAAVTPAKLSKAAKAALTGPAGPTGAAGIQGIQGKEGAAGATHVVVRFITVTTLNGHNGKATAECKSGEVATGGGAEVFEGNSAKVWFSTPGGRPTPAENEGNTPTGWLAEWFNESGTTDEFRVYAVCASP